MLLAVLVACVPLQSNPDPEIKQGPFIWPDHLLHCNLTDPAASGACVREAHSKPEFCHNISSLMWKTDCYVQAAEYNEDPEICKFIEPGSLANKDHHCYFVVAYALARKHNDSSYCNITIDSASEEHCVYVMETFHLS